MDRNRKVVFYVCDYWDILDTHCIYRTNIRSLAFDKIFNSFIRDWRLYVGYVENGLFYPQRLVSRSATYLGV